MTPNMTTIEGYKAPTVTAKNYTVGQKKRNKKVNKLTPQKIGWQGRRQAEWLGQSGNHAGLPRPDEPGALQSIQKGH